MIHALKEIPKELLFVAVLFFSANHFLTKPTLPPKSDYIAPPPAIQYLTAGFRIQMADSFWLRALNDIDYCEKKINETECKGKSWLFQILNMAAMLDPILEPVMYQVAGLSLTVIISDYEGASVLFDKGVKRYPKNWKLIYSAAYHAFYEEKNKLKAAGLYQMAAEAGAPAWVSAFAGRLAVESDSIDLANSILEKMIEMNTDEKLIQRLRERLKK